MKSENAGSRASLTLSSSDSSSSLARREITSFLILRPESNNLQIRASLKFGAKALQGFYY